MMGTSIAKTATVGAALSMAALLSMATPAAAHPGGLNAEGCHNNRKTGEYHCHRGSGGSSGASQGVRPVSSPGALKRSDGAYVNCAAARAAGAAPVRRGQPGYGPHLDRDGDGVGCA